jgi:hypothetical protein
LYLCSYNLDGSVTASTRRGTSSGTPTSWLPGTISGRCRHVRIFPTLSLISLSLLATRARPLGPRPFEWWSHSSEVLFAPLLVCGNEEEGASFYRWRGGVYSMEYSLTNAPNRQHCIKCTDAAPNRLEDVGTEHLDKVGLEGRRHWRARAQSGSG